MKLLNTQHKVYVGNWNARPIGLPLVPCFNLTTISHPKEFFNILNKLLDIDIFSNNPLVINLFPFQNVFVCEISSTGKSICKCLTDHPKYKIYKDSFFAGDFWQAFDNELWIHK